MVDTVIDEILINLNRDGTPLYYTSLKKKKVDHDYLATFINTLHILSHSVYDEDELEYIAFKDSVAILDEGKLVQAFARFDKNIYMGKVKNKLKEVIKAFETDYEEELQNNIIDIGEFTFFYKRINEIFGIKLTQQEELISELEALDIKPLDFSAIIAGRVKEESEKEPDSEATKNQEKSVNLIRDNLVRDYYES